MERVEKEIEEKVWRILFPLKVGDKVRFLGLGFKRRWRVGKILQVHVNPYTKDNFYVIETGRSLKEILHSHMVLSKEEIEIWKTSKRE